MVQPFWPRYRSQLGLLFSVSLAFLAAGLGSAFTTPHLDPWYESLTKPWFNPPNWVFGPVWTFLFAAMAVAAWYVWSHRKHPLSRLALGLYSLQLVLNVFWSYLFFGRQSPELALWEVGFFWLSILFTMVLFATIDRRAGWLFVPYIAWVSFAAFLNYAVVQLN
jgi:benzodiazapine receptor